MFSLKLLLHYLVVAQGGTLDMSPLSPKYDGVLWWHGHTCLVRFNVQYLIHFEAS